MSKPDAAPNTQASGSPGTTGGTSGFRQSLYENRQVLRIGLFVLATIALVGPIVLLARYRQLALGMPIFTWAVSIFIVTVSVAIADFVYERADEKSESTKLTLELMILGGAIGLATVLLGFALPFNSEYSADLLEGLEKWRATPLALVNPLAALFGGLTLMFISLQLGRGMEREHQSIRRIIYGFNALLTGLLLVSVLAIVNVLAYAQPFSRFFGRPFDWTKAEINSISPLLRGYLNELKEPVKGYIIIPPGDGVAEDCKTLLENCRTANPLVDFEIVNPREFRSQAKINEMREKYSFSDPLGLLIVVGAEDKDAKPAFAFVKYTDLAEQEAAPRGAEPSDSYSFKGENAFYSTLTSLTEGKMVIYFTTGHGELTFNEAANPMMRMPDAGGLSTLRTRITARKGVEVRPLPLDATTTKIPDDASVVAIVRPTSTFDPKISNVLRDYLKRERKTRTTKDANGREVIEDTVTAGKLMILVEPILVKEGGSASIKPTGLEGLLAEYSVQVGADRLLCLRTENPATIPAVAPPDSANPIAKAFSPSPEQVSLFMFTNVRSLRTMPEKAQSVNADPLMFTQLDFLVRAEPDANVDLQALAGRMKRDRVFLEKQISKQPINVALAVSEGGAPPGMPRDAAHGGQFKDTPKMVVFGSANWVSDDVLGRRGGFANADLFNSCISWLREKASIGSTIPDKKRQEYKLNIKEDEVSRLYLLPLGLMLLTVVGLGASVWVVRRR
jgi:hypothetical protein